MALTLIITDAGRAALVNAQHNGTNAVQIAAVGVTATPIVAGAATAALPGEIKRIVTISGTAVAANVIHLTVRDETADAYTMCSFALYLADGTLFASYGQPAAILQKTAGALMLLAVDVTLADIAATQIIFGETSFINPPATVDTAGVLKLATAADAKARVDGTKALTPIVAAGAVLDWIGYAPIQQGTGIGQLPNLVKMGWAGGTTVKVTVDSSDFGALVFERGGDGVWRSSNDGAGSGLDADLLDGQEGAWYANIVGRLGYAPVQLGTGIGQLANALKMGWSGTRIRVTVDNADIGPIVFDSNIADVWRASNDGAGSGLDADLLDGQDSSYYVNVAARLGYAPVQQGTGVGQLNNLVKMGWAGGTKVKVTVDTADFGALVFESGITDVWRASNDGAGSGLDADLLDGQDSSYYTNVPARLGFAPVQSGTGAGQYNNLVKIGWAGGGAVKVTIDNSDFGPLVFASGIADVWRASNDGAGSGLDADLLDGHEGAWYADVAGRLGYTPVQMGAGVGQLANLVKIGWSNDGLRATVDDTDLGAFAFRADLGDTGADGNGYWERRRKADGSIVIEQWGRATAPSGNIVTVTFPIEFTDASSVVVTAVNEIGSSNSAPTSWPGVGRTAVDSCDIVCAQASGSAVNGFGVKWRAIGR